MSATFIIVLIVCALAVALWFIRQGMDKRRMDARLARRVREDEDRARLVADELDTTRFYGDDYRGPGGRA